ncbi:hypothetical protein MINT15_16920 [Saccharomonospora viridis]|uniref:Uncharacterized protein n=1 Tax=Saccharomonospora viridis TaxID=1852 RepID=A0A837DBD4_9PSEU|nr:hypothetical protein MINT15_16920 [Saccharomonospora viridis]
MTRRPLVLLSHIEQHILFPGGEIVNRNRGYIGGVVHGPIVACPSARCPRAFSSCDADRCRLTASPPAHRPAGPA